MNNLSKDTPGSCSSTDPRIPGTPETACPQCGTFMTRLHRREHIGWGDYPGTGRFTRLWLCEGCEHSEERPVTNSRDDE